MSPRGAWAALLLVVIAAGCADKGSVSGVVTYKGKPVVAGRVTVLSADQGPQVATVQPDGRYQVLQVPVGPVRIAVESPDPRRAPGAPAGDGPPKAVPPGWQPLPAKYADVATSGLTMQVKGGSNALDIALD